MALRRRPGMHAGLASGVGRQFDPGRLVRPTGANAGFRTGSLTLGSSEFQAELAPPRATPGLPWGRYSGHPTDRLGGPSFAGTA
jgi:hypothetical protein